MLFGFCHGISDEHDQLKRKVKHYTRTEIYSIHNECFNLFFFVYLRYMTQSSSERLLQVHFTPETAYVNNGRTLHQWMFVIFLSVTTRNDLFWEFQRVAATYMKKFCLLSSSYEKQRNLVCLRFFQYYWYEEMHRLLIGSVVSERHSTFTRELRPS